MTGLEEGLAAVVGYLSTPLVSLAKRRNWPKQIKALLAAAVSALGAFGLIAAGPALSSLGWSVDLELADFRLLFLAVFAVQQATYQLEIPGAGTASLNDKLEEIGTPEDPHEHDALGL